MEKISHEKAMQEAIKEARKNGLENYQNGGPFGAAIVKDGEIISVAHNTVVGDKDATAHAEVNAIRKASQKLGTHDLSGCVLYASSEPCPMCLSAIIWANIKEVYYANTKEDSAEIGFRDDMIYNYIKGKEKDVIHLHQICREEAIKVYEEFKNVEDRQMY